MAIDRRTLISLASALAIMTVLVIWNQLHPKPINSLSIAQEAALKQLAGKYKEGIDFATQAIDKGQDLTQAHFIRASCLYQRMVISDTFPVNDLDLAEADYRYSLK